MTEAEKITMLRAIGGWDDSDTVLSAFLDVAGGMVVTRCYPFGDGTETVPLKYEITQVKVANYLLNKRGAEGETGHTENGTSVSYSDGDVPRSVMGEIIPFSRLVAEHETTP